MQNFVVRKKMRRKAPMLVLVIIVMLYFLVVSERIRTSHEPQSSIPSNQQEVNDRSEQTFGNFDDDDAADIYLPEVSDFDENKVNNEDQDVVLHTAISPDDHDQIMADDKNAPHVLDVIYYQINDPYFGLANSGLNEAETDALKMEVAEIWRKAMNNRLELRIHTRKFNLDRDRALAYLYYIVGHPLVGNTRPDMQIWITKPFERELAALEPVLEKFLSNISLMNQIMSQLELKGSMSLEEFSKLVPDSLRITWDAIRMDPDHITKEAFREVVSVSKERRGIVRKVNLAFRLFYNFVGMPSKLLFSWAPILKERPMLFMHYAIGRDADVKSHTVNRGEWDFANTISLYPAPYYHALNGRGSQNWLDVVFRTASCWDQQNRRFVFKEKDFGLLQCRWGVRSWERHTYTIPELGRMIAHEIGHCLGLGHVQPHCVVYPSADQANLMQQQRNIGLEEWVGSKRCACLQTSPSCGQCRCTFDDENFAKVGGARHLDITQTETVLHYVRKRDYMESPPASGFTLVGVSLAEISSKEEALLLQGGDILGLARTSGPKGRVRVGRLRMKIQSAKRGLVRLILYAIKGGCAIASARRLGFELEFQNMNLPVHQEWSLEGIDLEPDESLGISASSDVRIHTSKAGTLEARGCLVNQRTAVSKVPLANYDIMMI